MVGFFICKGFFLFFVEIIIDMAISKENFIVVYRYGDLDSADFAAYYAAKYSMDIDNTDPSGNSGTIGGIYWEVNGQLLGIQCSNSEILGSESVFNTQVLNPIAYALNNAPEFEGRNIWGIVLGYSIPGGFYSNDDIISSTSRIARVNQTFSKQKANKLYNRSIFSRFDADDSNIALICSRLDGSNVQQVKVYIDNADNLNKQLFINGMLFVDPYSDKQGVAAEAYQEEILDFYNNLVPTLNLDTWSTSFMDPYVDVAIPYVSDDSFVWSWFTDRAYGSFFQRSNSIRTFFYNADYDGGFSFRDDNSNRWPSLSMNNGYVASAGAMSNPSIGGFLNPNTFFDSLLRGATIGEAYLFSLPYLDWTMALFGDPLASCSFPSAVIVDEDEINEHECWNLMGISLSKSAAHLYKKASELDNIQIKIVDQTTPDRDVEVELLYVSNDLLRANQDTVWRGQLIDLTNTLFDYPSQQYRYSGTIIRSPSVDEYISEKGFKLSRLLVSVAGGPLVSEENLLDEGWWQFEFTVQDDTTEFVNYHFRLSISDVANFSNVLFTLNSFSIRNWVYEKTKDNFQPITFSGVSSSYIGRKIRYASRQDNVLGINEYLTRGETYYFRVTQYDAQTGEEYSDRLFTDIIYT